MVMTSPAWIMHCGQASSFGFFLFFVFKTIDRCAVRESKCPLCSLWPDAPDWVSSQLSPFVWGVCQRRWATYGTSTATLINGRSHCGFYWSSETPFASCCSFKKRKEIYLCTAEKKALKKDPYPLNFTLYFLSVRFYALPGNIFCLIQTPEAVLKQLYLIFRLDYSQVAPCWVIKPTFDHSKPSGNVWRQFGCTHRKRELNTFCSVAFFSFQFGRKWKIIQNYLSSAQ